MKSNTPISGYFRKFMIQISFNFSNTLACRKLIRKKKEKRKKKSVIFCLFSKLLSDSLSYFICIAREEEDMPDQLLHFSSHQCHSIVCACNPLAQAPETLLIIGLVKRMDSTGKKKKK